MLAHLSSAARYTASDLELLDERYTRAMERPGGLRLYAEEMWGVIEPYQPFIHTWHTDAIFEHLEAVTWGHIQDLIITVPPRHTKSISVAVMWPTWEWGPANKPYTRWLFSAYAAALSLRDSQKRRRIIADERFQSRWGDRFTLGGMKFATDGTSKYENNFTGYHMATSVKGSNTGEGGDRVVVDDPINVKDVHSDTIRASVNDWWDMVMSTRRNNPKTSARVIIMQRTHENDLVGHVRAKADGGGYTHLSLPSEYTGKKCVTFLGTRRWEDRRTVVGELLNPDRFGPKEIAEAKRDLGSYGYSAQHQQEPAPAEGGIMKKTWWRFWVPMGHEMAGKRYFLDGTLNIAGFEGAPVVPLPRGFDRKNQSWDMNFGSERRPDDVDYVVGQCWGEILGVDGYAAAMFLLHQVREQWGFTDTLNELITMVVDRRWASGLKLVEAKANGPAVIDSLRTRVNGLTPYYPDTDKKGRMHAASPIVEAGNIYLPLPTLPGYSWVGDFIKELSTFPNATNDDQCDAFTQLALTRFNLLKITAESLFAKLDV